MSKGIENGYNSLRNFTSPHKSSLYKKQSFGRTERLHPGNNLITQFDAEAACNNSNNSYNGLSGHRKPPKDNAYSENMTLLEKAVQPEIDPLKRHSNGPLVDISNTMNISHVDNKQHFGEKRKFRSVSSVSPFKKPRNSFVTPLSKKKSSDINGNVSKFFEHKLHDLQNIFLLF